MTTLTTLTSKDVREMAKTIDAAGIKELAEQLQETRRIKSNATKQWHKTFSAADAATLATVVEAHIVASSNFDYISEGFKGRQR